MRERERDLFHLCVFENLESYCRRRPWTSSNPILEITSMMCGLAKRVGPGEGGRWGAVGVVSGYNHGSKSHKLGYILGITWV